MSVNAVANAGTDEKVMVTSSLEIRPLLAPAHGEGQMVEDKFFKEYLATFLTRVDAMLASNLATVSFEPGYVSKADDAMFIHTDVKIVAEPESDLDVALRAWEECPLEDEAGYVERQSMDVDADLHRAVEAHLAQAARKAGFAFRFSANSAEREGGMWA
ncbi:hypothetical protein [Arthrobacter sp. UYCo732]|uniref:hypothetical protein n=1 Tax=Arthrobacter sp. UYCo732 TaxID=3156336 RepID=UPI0033946DEF